MKQFKRKLKKAFTITELVIVIAVIAILAAVLIPTFTYVVKRANQSSAMQAAKSASTVYYSYSLGENSGSTIEGYCFESDGYVFAFTEGSFNATPVYTPDDGEVSGYVSNMTQVVIPATETALLADIGDVTIYAPVSVTLKNGETVLSENTDTEKAGTYILSLESGKDATISADSATVKLSSADTDKVTVKDDATINAKATTSEAVAVNAVVTVTNDKGTFVLTTVIYVTVTTSSS